MTIHEVEKFIQESKGKIFSIKFIKRTTGEERKMVCRTGVQKHLAGGEAAYEPAQHNLIFCFDMQKNGYRSIPKEGIREIMIDGEWVPVTH